MCEMSVGKICIHVALIRGKRLREREHCVEETQAPFGRLGGAKRGDMSLQLHKGWKDENENAAMVTLSDAQSLRCTDRLQRPRTSR